MTEVGMGEGKEGEMILKKDEKRWLDQLEVLRQDLD